MNYKELSNLVQKKSHTIAMFFTRHGLSIKSVADIRFYIDYVNSGKRISSSKDVSHLEPYQFKTDDKKINKARELVASRKLTWHLNPMELSESSIVEHVFSNGNFTDFFELIRIFGKKKIVQIFQSQITQKRINYRPQTLNFFKHYFALN